MSEILDLSALELHLKKPVYRYHQHQGKSNDCGPTSLAIAANSLLGEERLHGPTVAQEMNHPVFTMRPFPHPVVYRIPDWATFPWGIVRYLRHHDIQARWSLFGTVERLRRNLLVDQLTMIVIGEPLRWEQWRYTGWAHVKILFGYTPGLGFLFVDPAEERRTHDPDPWTQHGLAWQREDEFLRHWRGLLRTYIEVGKPGGPTKVV